MNHKRRRAGADGYIATILVAVLVMAPSFWTVAHAQGSIPEIIDLSDDQCRLDLGCSMSLGESLAKQYCTPKIEKEIKREIEWRDGFFGTLYPRARWKNRAKGHIEFRGDGARFRNRDGSENWLQYICVIDVVNQEFVSFIAWPGRDEQ